jgi:hypothetical protein
MPRCLVADRVAATGPGRGTAIPASVEPEVAVSPWDPRQFLVFAEDVSMPVPRGAQRTRDR